jgi:hypothetical protein
MSAKHPVVSGEWLIKILVREGFSVRKQAEAVLSFKKSILKQSGLCVENLLE